MALVDSDLFLVQDASTKANYKLSFENLTKEIALDIDLDTVYVEVDGDNMTGDLTLGTDRITLATTGLITTWRKTSNAPDLLQHWKSNVGASNRTQVSFSADGSADFNGDITANAFAGDGSQLTNLPIQPGLWVESGTNLSPITTDINLSSIKNIATTGHFVTQRVAYSINQNSPYIIATTPAYNGTTTNWGTYGFQHRIKSNSTGTGRVTIDSNMGEAFCVLNNKNVGIGTDNPQVALEVNGTIEATNIDGGTYA